MSLQRRDFTPEPPEDLQPAPRSMRNHPGSPPLMRLFSALGFGVASIGVFNAGAKLIGITTEQIVEGTAKTDWRIALIFIAALISGLIVGLMGAMLGLSIPVRSERANHFLTALWHYMANGSMGWYALTGVGLIFVYGADAAVFWDNVDGPLFMLQTFMIAGAGSLLMGLILMIFKQLEPGSRPKFLVGLSLTAPMGMLMGYLQCLLMKFEPIMGIAGGAVFAALLMYFSGPMIMRDLADRQTHTGNQ